MERLVAVWVSLPLMAIIEIVILSCMKNGVKKRAGIRCNGYENETNGGNCLPLAKKNMMTPSKNKNNFFFMTIIFCPNLLAVPPDNSGSVKCIFKISF